MRILSKIFATRVWQWILLLSAAVGSLFIGVADVSLWDILFADSERLQIRFRRLESEPYARVQIAVNLARNFGGAAQTRHWSVML